VLSKLVKVTLAVTVKRGSCNNSVIPFSTSYFKATTNASFSVSFKVAVNDVAEVTVNAEIGSHACKDSAAAGALSP
jgi:hypothetical protein